MWAYNGWHGVTPLAEEIRDPQRNVPAGLIRGTAILVALYVGANIAYHGVLSMGEMAAAGDHAAEEMLGKLLGQTGMAAMSAVIMCSTFGAINTNLLQAPRITFAMGRDGAFFRSLGRVQRELWNSRCIHSVDGDDVHLVGLGCGSGEAFRCRRHRLGRQQYRAVVNVTSCTNRPARVAATEDREKPARRFRYFLCLPTL